MPVYRYTAKGMSIGNGVFNMRDYTICTYCVYNNRKAVCKKGHSIMLKTKDGIRVGPKDGKCEDKKEETL